MASFGTPGDLWHQYNAQGQPMNWQTAGLSGPAGFIAPSGIPTAPTTAATSADPNGVAGSIAGQTTGSFNPNFGAFDVGGQNIGDLIPNSPIYLSAEAQATAAYQNALAQINQNRQATLQQYGYMGTIDPHNGTITSMKTDPNNQFGEYQTMLNTHAGDQRAVLANDAARGLGAASGPRGGGLAAQGITADHRSFGADSAQLGANLMNALMGFQTQQNNAQTTMDNSLWQAELAAAQQAILNGMFNTAPAGNDNSNNNNDSNNNNSNTNTTPTFKPTSVFSGNTKTRDRKVKGGRI
jgi:hypothetical protein